MEDQVTIKDYQLSTILGGFGQFLEEHPDEDERTQKDREEIMTKLSKFLWSEDHTSREEFVLMRRKNLKGTAQ